MTLELTSTNTVRVPEIQYSSTVSTEYEYSSTEFIIIIIIIIIIIFIIIIIMSVIVIIIITEILAVARVNKTCFIVHMFLGNY